MRGMTSTMQSKIFLQVVAGLSLIALTFGASSAHAGGVVGSGTPVSCTEAAFDAARQGGGVVTFNCGPNPTTITLSAVKTIQADTTMDGAGLITLTGSNAGVYIQVFSDKVLTLNHLTLSGFSYNQGGVVQNFGTLNLINVTLSNNQNSNQGGTIYNNGVVNAVNSRFLNNKAVTSGGAIYNNGGDVIVRDSTFTGNAISSAIGDGGAIANDSGVLTITASIFTGNSALDGGAVSVGTGSTAVIVNSQLMSNTAGYGGGVENRGTLTVTGSLISHNKATGGDGGGLWNLNGKMAVRTSTVSNNQAKTTGGGISHYGDTLALNQVTLSGNTSEGNGGGIYASAPMNVTNVTISGNQATGVSAGGGGIYQGAGSASVHQVTLANNTASFGRAIYKESVAGSSLFLQSSIVSVNGGPNTVACDGMISSIGYNVSDGNCSGLTQNGDAQMIALNLGPLANNGGSTLTHLPASNSPAVNRVALANCLIVDQRGANRPVGTLCDSGAIEVGGLVPLAYLPTLVR